MRLEKILTWTGSLVYDQAHVLNEYIVTLYLSSDCDDQRHQGIAYGRLKYWFENVMHHAALINQQDPQIEIYRQTYQRIIALPDDPVDHLVTIMLYLKLNAIMEERIWVDEIKLSSDQGDHVSYLYSDEIDNFKFDTHGWWKDPRPVWFNTNTQDSKVVTINRETEWTYLGLGWETEVEDSAQIFYPDFNKR